MNQNKPLWQIIIFGISGAIILLGMGLFCIETVFYRNHSCPISACPLPQKQDFVFHHLTMLVKIRKNSHFSPFLSNFRQKTMIWDSKTIESLPLCWYDGTRQGSIYGIPRTLTLIWIETVKSTQCFIIKWNHSSEYK